MKRKHTGPRKVSNLHHTALATCLEIIESGYFIDPGTETCFGQRVAEECCGCKANGDLGVERIVYT